MSNVGGQYIVDSPGVDGRIYQHNEICKDEGRRDASRVCGRCLRPSRCASGVEEDAGGIHRRMLQCLRMELT